MLHLHPLISTYIRSWLQGVRRQPASAAHEGGRERERERERVKEQIRLEFSHGAELQ
jgi:hypothetical protein